MFIEPNRIARAGLALLVPFTVLACNQAAPPSEPAAEPTTDSAVASTDRQAAPVALDLPSDIDAASAEIDEAYLRETITYLSSDKLEGRGPGSAGDIAARTYIAEQLADAGAQPAGDAGTWEQAFGIVGITATVPETWTFQRGGQSLDLAWWDEFIAGSGVQRDKASIRDAELVFVGYGIEAPEYGWDDFKGASLAGKVLVMLNNDPDWDESLFAGDRRLYYGRWSYKYESAARQGAAGAIIIHTDPSAGYGWNVIQSSWSGTQFELPAQGEPRVEVPAWTTYEATERLWQLAGRDLAADIESARKPDFQPVHLGIRASLDLDVKIARDVLDGQCIGHDSRRRPRAS